MSEGSWNESTLAHQCGGAAPLSLLSASQVHPKLVGSAAPLAALGHVGCPQRQVARTHPVAALAGRRRRGGVHPAHLFRSRDWLHVGGRAKVGGVGARDLG